MPLSRPVRALAVALLAALMGALLPAATARAADRTVAGGRLDWGIKASFQSYVTGPIAKGSWALRGGAATTGESQFRFHSATGSYDPADGAFDARYSGGVRFVGHRKPDGTHELDLTISNPAVRVTGGGAGTLYADMTSKAKGTGTVTTATRVPLATLDLTGVTMRGGGTAVVLDNLPAKLTSQGARAFAGYYSAGTPLDPVSLTADITPPTSAPPTTDASTHPADKPGEHGRFTDAAVDWGVRRTYREYVTGPIAKGEWRLADGAQDGGALFRFPRGKGAYDERKRTLDGTFAGTLGFHGKDVDLTLGGVSVRVADGRGTLAADVTRDGATDRDVPLVTFAVGRLRPDHGLIGVTEASATLTARGAKAFGGMYRAGTGMDPVSLAVAVEKDAELPALPDLGKETPKAAARTTPPARTTGSASDGGSSSSPAVPLAAGGAGVLVVAAAVLVVLRRRRKATHASASAASPNSTDGAPAPDSPNSAPAPDSLNSTDD